MKHPGTGSVKQKPALYMLCFHKAVHLSLEYGSPGVRMGQYQDGPREACIFGQLDICMELLATEISELLL
jgi:hypothetical protein